MLSRARTLASENPLGGRFKSPDKRYYHFGPEVTKCRFNKPDSRDRPAVEVIPTIWIRSSRGCRAPFHRPSEVIFFKIWILFPISD